MDIYVARQPIFDRRLRVYGYEILYRMKEDDQYCMRTGDAASLAVIKNTVLVIGAEKIAGGKKAFINFTRNLILDNTAYLLPKDLTVIEILEDVRIDDQVLSRCKEIKKKGYTLALDDFVLNGNRHNPLLNLVDIIKVDYRATTNAEREEIVRHFKDTSIRLLAEKTETIEEFKEAKKLGFSYFQGYFFSKPIVIARKDIPVSRINYLRILQELANEHIRIRKLREILETDPSLTYKLLKYINSSFFSLRYEVTSIEHALALLGENEIRKWAFLVILGKLSKGFPDELIKISLIRARLCEAIATKIGLSKRKTEFFLMGMISTIDAFIGRPLEEIVQELPVAKGLKDALLGKDNVYGMVYSLVLCYERGDWDRVNQWIRKLALNEEDIPKLYTEAIRNVNEIADFIN